MIAKKLLELLEKSKKNYISIAEIHNYLNIEKTTLKVILSRLTKQDKLYRLFRGYYCSPQNNPDLEQLAIELCFPSYLSLESALSIHGILSEVPARLTFVTREKSVTYNVRNNILEFAHVQAKLFFGYKILGHTQIARPEKSLLDELYLIGIKKRSLDLNRLDLTKLDKKLFLKWLELYPPSTVKLAKELRLVL